MLHAIPYLFIALVYVATCFGLDKFVADVLKTAAYLVLALKCCGVPLRSVPFGRWIALLILVGAMQAVEVRALVAGDTRPVVVLSSGVGREGGV